MIYYTFLWPTLKTIFHADACNGACTRAQGGGGGWFQSQVSGYSGREIFRGKKLPPCGAIKIQRTRLPERG